VASRTSGRNLSTRGDALPPGEKRVPSTHKKLPPFLRAQKKTPLGIKPTTYGYNFNPMVTSHGGAGRLSRGIGHIQNINNLKLSTITQNSQ
jgi:hypothetical protein